MRKLAAAFLVMLAASSSAFAADVALPSRQEAEAVCAAVISDAHAGLTFLDARQKLDLNNDGTPEPVNPICGGSMNTCAPGLEGDGGPWYFPEEGSNGFGGGYGFAWVSYQNKNYTVYYAGDRRDGPMQVTYVAPDNIERLVCQIRTDAYAALIPITPDDAGTCQRFSGGIDSQYLPEIAVDLKYLSIPERQQTYSKSSLNLDVDGDGVVEHLVKMEISFGGGRGCGFTYYVQTTPEGVWVSDTRTAQLLDEIQEVVFNKRNVPPYGVSVPSCGGNKLQWTLDHDASPLLEFKGNPTNVTRGWDWWVRRIQYNQVVKVCRGERLLKSVVDFYGPSFTQQGQE